MLRCLNIQVKNCSRIFSENVVPGSALSSEENKIGKAKDRGKYRGSSVFTSHRAQGGGQAEAEDCLSCKVQVRAVQGKSLKSDGHPDQLLVTPENPWSNNVCNAMTVHNLLQ